MKGVTLDLDNPFSFDFIIHPGDSGLKGEQLRGQTDKLIKYFMASLTTPEDQMWVNLSPYEKDRIIPEGLGDTEMGRDMLAQDYMLKQITASLMYTENELGSEFWKRVYARAQEEYGTTEIPMNTFNKVWIVPEKATIYENGTTAVIVESHLKVLLEEDYLALEMNQYSAKHGLGNVTKDDLKVVSGVSSEVIREIIIPEIEREVNHGKIFSNLRQISNSVILATWYKNKVQGSILQQIYIDQMKTVGVDTKDKEINLKIYNQYVKAFKKGVYDFIKEDYDEITQEVIPRKYFSGGENLEWSDKTDTDTSESARRGAGREVKASTYARVEMKGAGGEDKEKTNLSSVVEDGEAAMLANIYADPQIVTKNARISGSILNDSIAGDVEERIKSRWPGVVEGRFEISSDLELKTVNQDAMDQVLSKRSPIQQKNGKFGYLDFYKFKENDKVIIYIVNTKKTMTEPIDRDNVWKRRIEITDEPANLLFEESEILEEFLQYIHDNTVGVEMGSAIRSNEGKDSTKAYIGNSQYRFEQYVKGFHSGEMQYEYLNQYHIDMVDSNEYSHLKHFGWIYWQQLKALKQALSLKEGEVVVADVGTGFGHFILTAASFLSKEELKRTRFVGIDVRDDNMKLGAIFAEQYSDLNVEWQTVDITETSVNNNLRALNADVWMLS